VQLREGLGVTGMHDHVSWGIYISNFVFLVGLAAAAVMLVFPDYVRSDADLGRARRHRRHLGTRHFSPHHPHPRRHSYRNWLPSPSESPVADPPISSVVLGRPA
jgi:hypothetical protein